jgi:thioredoxin-like negative regulator of GroEL
MTGLALCLVIQVVGAGNDNTSYEQAYKAAESNGRPILVLVGADWCPGCQRMKGGTLARMSGSGRLSRVNYAIVNSDREPELARQLMRGNSIPQLIVYSKTGKDSWKRDQITGATSEDAVAALVDRAAAAKVETSRTVTKNAGG